MQQLTCVSLYRDNYLFLRRNTTGPRRDILVVLKYDIVSIVQVIFFF